jgi:GNAT superfamily N-acetyltransferase
MLLLLNHLIRLCAPDSWGWDMYRIREVDGTDEQDFLTEINEGFSFPAIELADFEDGNWWIGTVAGTPISYCGMIPCTHYDNAGYFKRVGVLAGHRGHGLQQRHMRALERKARAQGLSRLVSDTTDNPISGNNFIKAGWKIFEPENPWAFPHTIYWTKAL